MDLKNLKNETLADLHENGKCAEDIKFVCGSDFQIPVELFWELANAAYDSGFGAPEVAEDLMLIGDDFWMERHGYDGREWWEFKKLPDVSHLPMLNVKALTVAQSFDKFGKKSVGWESLKSLNDLEKNDE